MSKDSEKKVAKLKITSEEEKDFFERICAISQQPKEVVRDVLRSTLIAITASLYSNQNKVCIPYVCNLEIDFEDKLQKDKLSKRVWRITDISLNATATDSLTKEIEAISEGELPPSLFFFKDRIRMKIEDILDLEDDEMDLDLPRI